MNFQDRLDALAESFTAKGDQMRELQRRVDHNGYYPTPAAPEPEPPKPGQTLLDAALAAGDLNEARFIADRFNLEAPPTPGSIDQGARTTIAPLTVADQIAEAERTGDWQTAGRLKAAQLYALGDAQLVADQIRARRG